MIQLNAVAEKNPEKILKIIIDTREQHPFDFSGYHCETERGTLHTGDYSIVGMTDKIVIERKSVGDLAACMTIGRDRFERELERMREFEAAAVVVEEPLTNIRNGRYRSRLNPDSFEQSILSFSIRYRVPFLFGKNRRHAEWVAFNALRHYWNKQTEAKQKIGFAPFQG